MKVLVIAAHPDDEVLGCGGAMARHVRAGDDVVIAIVAEGITSRYEQRSAAPVADLEALRADARRAGGILGVGDVRFLGFPDNRLDTVPLLEVAQAFERLITDVRPRRIYTHHPGDLNIDHSVVSRAVTTATRPMAGQAVRELLAFEVFSSTEWAFGQVGSPFQPNLFVGIGDVLQTKLDAMACYRSEVRSFPHPRSLEVLRAGAVRWGSVAGLDAAEAFQTIRVIE